MTSARVLWFIWWTLLGFVFVLVPATSGRAQERVEASRWAPEPAASAPEGARQAVARREIADARPALDYQPPRRGSPRTRSAPKIRDAVAQPEVTSLAPARVGQTLREAPALFWYVDGVPPVGSEVVFTLVTDSQIEPVVERRLPPPTQLGIQRVRLSEWGVTLEPDVEYEWFVALVPDPEDRTQDSVGRGVVRRVGVGVPSQGPPGAQGFAAGSLWYDALECVSNAIEAEPDNHALRAQRNALLRRAELHDTLE